MVEDPRLLIDAKPCQRETLGSECSLLESLEVIAAFIAEKSGGIETASECLLNLAKKVWDLIERIDSDRLDWIEEEQASLVGGIEAGGLKQDGIRTSGNQGVPLLQAIPLFQD